MTSLVIKLFYTVHNQASAEPPSFGTVHFKTATMGEFINNFAIQLSAWSEQGRHFMCATPPSPLLYSSNIFIHTSSKHVCAL